MPKKLTRFLFTLTPALLKAIDLAKGDQDRNAWIENTLWRLTSIRNTGVDREPRNPSGYHPMEETTE